MGGAGRTSNIALSMVAPATPYASIPLPIGLTQVLPDLEAFNPTNDEFNPAWALESASSPMHTDHRLG